MSNIFKAYDVRGVYPDEINKDIVHKIGFATAKFLQSKYPDRKLKLVVGEDARIGSPAVRGAVLDAITKAGVDVYYIGQSTSPLFYFSLYKLNADGGIMVTASHNPAQYTGLKILGRKDESISSETGLKEIEKMAEGPLESTSKPGVIEEKSLVNEYIRMIIRESQIFSSIDKVRKLKIVVDGSNGMISLVLKPLLDILKFNFKTLDFNIDETFPHHLSDVSNEENIKDLRDEIVKSKADIGLAFDGDGDRIAFVDEGGRKIDSGYILCLLFKSMSGFFSKPKAVYDFRFSRSVKYFFGSRGFKSRVGYVFIKQVMKENRADIAGELSGHFYFKKLGYVESSELTMLMILRVLAESGKPISELIKPFQKYAYSGEINIDISHNPDIKNKINGILEEKYRDGQVEKFDGLVVEYKDWWFNLRPSNTEPLLRLVVEADTKELMEKKKEEILDLVK